MWDDTTLHVCVCAQDYAGYLECPEYESVVSEAVEQCRAHGAVVKVQGSWCCCEGGHAASSSLQRANVLRNLCG